MAKTVAIVLGVVIPVCVLVIVAAILGKWYSVASSRYSDRVLTSGEKYTVNGRNYTFPRLPIVKGTAALLKDDFLAQQRDLFVHVTSLLRQHNLTHWVSGGTLLGFIRHRTFMPWDDDIDMHVPWRHREYLWSDQFARACGTLNMEVITLKGASLNYATKEGAAIRIRHQRTFTPVCDIFFVAITGPHQIGKVDSWKSNGRKGLFSKKEVWHSDDIFPVQHKTIDDITVPLPRHPEKVLRQQYGTDVMHKIYARPVLFSHQTPFETLNWVWNKRS